MEPEALGPNSLAWSERAEVVDRRNTWPIIVGGCHRSGTSLLRRILDAHSRIYCGPEVKFFRDFYNDYLVADPLRHVRFMASVRAILPEPELLEVLGAAFVSLHERAASVEGKLRWADKNPENVLYWSQWQRLLGDRWVFVHVVRNPLDTIASIKESNWSRSIPTDLDERIAFYMRYTQSGRDFGMMHPDRYYRVVYEDLIAHPPGVPFPSASALEVSVAVTKRMSRR